MQMLEAQGTGDSHLHQVSLSEYPDKHPWPKMVIMTVG